MTTYTITVGAGSGANAGYYGYSDGSDGEAAFGSISPGGSGITFFAWASDGSALVVYTPDADPIIWNGVEYTPADLGGGLWFIYVSSPTGPFPTSGTSNFSVGVAATVYTLALGTGAFTLAGQALGFSRPNRVLAIGTGNFAFTGRDVGFFKGISANITVGSFLGSIYGYSQGLYGSISWASGSAPPDAPTQVAWASSGVSVQMAAPRPAKIVLNGSSYTLSGSDGAYASSGSGLGGPYPTSGTVDILFIYDSPWVLSVGAGAFTLTGQDVALSKTGVTYTFPLGTGVFTLTGQNLTLTKSGVYTLSLGTGSFALSGQAVALKASRILPLGPGSFTLTGQSLGMTVSGPARRPRFISSIFA